MAQNVDKQAVFAAFIAKAAKRLEEKKVHKTCTLHVPSLDENVKVRGLTSAEVADCMNTDDASDPYAADKYSVYLATVEPSLKDMAVEMKEKGQISSYTEICNIFEIYELQQIARKVMELSGVTGKNKVETVVENLKN